MRFSTSGILLPFLPVLLFSSATAATLHVGPGGHPTLSAAVAAAQPGDTIEVSAGNHSGDVVIDKALILRGPNHGRPAGGTAVRVAEAVLSGSIRVTAAAPQTELSGLSIRNGAGADPGFAVRIEASGVTLRDSVLSHAAGADPDSSAVIATAGAASPVISGNLISGSGNGILLRSSGAATVTANTVTDNTIGLDLDSQSGAVVSANTFRANATAGIRAGGTTAGSSVRSNIFQLNGTAIRNLAAAAVDARQNFWDTGNQPPASAAANGFTGDVLFNPWYADETLTTLVTGVLADATIAPGGSMEAAVLHIAPGTSLAVEQGKLTVASLAMAAGSSLEVIGGELTLGVAGGGSHTIGGTFRVTHSLGSIEILGDTTFSGDTLALVSDFHIAAGVSLTITGSLVLDGCHLNSPAVWNLISTPSSVLEMARCRVENAALQVGSAGTRITSSHFSGSTIRVSPAGSGAQVFHNVFADGAGTLSVQPGATVVDSAEGWGNVTAEAAGSNRMSLSLRAPALPGRTLAADGGLFVQPGDPVVARLHTANHLARVQAAEALVSWHTGFLTFGQMVLDPAWGSALFTGTRTGPVLGNVDAAAGLTLGLEDPDGTLADSQIGDFHFTAGSAEGRTALFFRNPDAGDPAHSGTRLTTSTAGVPAIVADPFTRNTGAVVIDGTAPLVEPGATATQSATNVLQSGVFTRIGTVAVTLKAFDALAGIDAAGVRVTLSGPATLQGSFTSRTAETLHGETYDRFTFGVPVTASTPDGIYTVSATVADRSGNATTVTVGTVEVVRYIARITVASDGIMDGVMREVTLTGTGVSGNTLFTLVQPVVFNSGTGSITLANIPAELSHVSLKTAWTVRRKLPCAPDVAGDAVATFTGADRLRGGDFNADNAVNLADYIIMNSRWLTMDAMADINGDGGVSLTDFNFLNANWLIAGDAP